MKFPNQARPVARGYNRSLDRSAGVNPAGGVVCDLCKLACNEFSGIAKTLCLLACDNTVC